MNVKEFIAIDPIKKINKIITGKKIYTVKNKDELPNEGGVYLFYSMNSDNLIFYYIGETSSFKERFNRHLHMFLNKKNKKKTKHKLYSKIINLCNDENNLYFVPIEFISNENERYTKEILYIRFLENKTNKFLNRKKNNSKLLCKYGFGNVITSTKIIDNKFRVSYTHIKKNSCNCKGYLF